MSELLHTLLADQLSYYRLQRHDFLNHWQVIRGYLQLNMPERAMDYLKCHSGDLSGEQEIGQIPQPLIAASLLSLIIELKKIGIPAEIELEQEFKQEWYWHEHPVEEYGEAFYGYTKECLAETRKKVGQESGEHEAAEGKSALKARIALFGNRSEAGGTCIFAIEDQQSNGKMVTSIEREFRLI